MTASEFVTAIKAITPNECEFSMMPEGFAQIYLEELFIGNKKAHTIIKQNDAVIDLVCNYDVSKLTIMIFRFNKSDELKETERFIYFGWREAFPLAILKETGEVLEMDWADDERIMGYFALEENSLSGIISKKNKWDTEHLVSVAGGVKYKENVMELFIAYKKGE